MDLAEINNHTEDIFFRCLHERPPDPRVLLMRRKWRDIYKPKGHRAKVLIDDNGDVVGMTNYIPIEYSPFEGSDLMAILCIWVSRPKRGYGRYVLAEIENDARQSGCTGVVVAGNQFNPSTFYEHMGYARVEQSGSKVLLWKPFNDSAKPPRLLSRKAPQRHSHTTPGKVQVVSITDGWCGDGCEQCVMIRDVISRINDKAELTEISSDEETKMRTHGESHDVLYIDGEPFRPDGPPASESEIEQACLDRFAERNR